MTMLIEQTAKKYKFWFLVGAAIGLTGVVVTPIGLAMHPLLGSVGIALIFLGVGVLLYARIGAWWNHR